MSIVCDSDIVLYFSLKVCILWINNNLLRKQQGLHSEERQNWKSEVIQGTKEKNILWTDILGGIFLLSFYFVNIHTTHFSFTHSITKHSWSMPFLNFTTSLSNLSIFLWNIEIGDFPWNCRGTNQIRLTSTHWVEKLGFSNFC